MLKPLTDTQRDALKHATAVFEASLDKAAPYLEGRGITTDLARLYQLGFVDAETAPPGYKQFAGRLAIPYVTPAGVVDIRFRTLGSSSAKYLSRAGATPTLYNVGALHRPFDSIAICEGELDAITLDGLCKLPAVGCPGAQAWAHYWQRLFADYSRVFVLCDGDEAGKTFGAALAKDIDSAVVIHLPDGHDVNSLYLERGVAGIRAVMGLDSAQPPGE